MSLLSVLLLAGAMFVLAATPGPGVFATVARALASGFVPAAELVVGIVIGDLVYLLLAIWGGKKRQYAATKFILYTAGSSLFILIVGLAMAFYGGDTSFEDLMADLAALIETQLAALEGEA